MQQAQTSMQMYSLPILIMIPQWVLLILPRSAQGSQNTGLELLNGQKQTHFLEK